MMLTVDRSPVSMSIALLHPHMESVGPLEYEPKSILLESGAFNGVDATYRRLEEEHVLPRCLSVHDGRALQRAGIEVFRAFFGSDTTVPLWKTAAILFGGELHVACIVVGDGDTLSIVWHSNAALSTANDIRIAYFSLGTQREPNDA